MESSKTIIRRLLPAAAALALFFVVSAVYFAPQFRGEVLPQHDVMQYDGYAPIIISCVGLMTDLPSASFKILFAESIRNRASACASTESGR